jgi:hypothetical protein
MDVGMADAGQGFVMSPRTERRRTPSSGRLWHRLVGNSPWQMDVDHDGQDATIDAGRFPGDVAALMASLARVG